MNKNQTNDDGDPQPRETATGGNHGRYRKILESIREAYFEVDLAGNFTFFNDSLCRLTGYTREELTGLNYRLFSDEKNSKKVFLAFSRVHRTGEPAEVFGWHVTAKDGTKRYIEASISPDRDASGQAIGFKGIIRDATMRRMDETAIRNSEAKYRDIFENAIEGIYQSTPDGKIITVNAAFARMTGYETPAQLLDSLNDKNYQFYVHPEDRGRFMEIMKASGFVNGFELELYKKDGSTFWAVLNVRAVRDKKGGIVFIEGFMEDITPRKLAEKNLHKTLERLRKAFGATIQVMASAVEMKDPYTAGHQVRVADIARAISTEMQLPQEMVEGIRMAGIIHDIGKLSVPAELLSKPTKLSNIEFSLVKEHSRNGYQMLKDVDSPWPLAEIVYQHHERMNGTGYPRGLKGDEIITEARVIAVADVVEAIASHRPYRASLGLEPALEEIEKNKGVLYDEDVVNACSKLFREKGYKIA